MDLGYITVKVDFNMSQEIDVRLSEVLSNTFSENFSMSEIYELAGKIAGILEQPFPRDPIDTQISKKVIEMYERIVLDASDEIYDKAVNLRDYSEMEFSHEAYNHAFDILVTNKDVSK